jgi:hypothetical protein
VEMKGIQRNKRAIPVGGYQVADLGEPEDSVIRCRWNKEVFNFITSKQGAQEVNSPAVWGDS